jgi:hypothetical protein
MPGICSECGSALCYTCHDCSSVCQCPSQAESDSVSVKDLVTIEDFTKDLRNMLRNYARYVRSQDLGDVSVRSHGQWFALFAVYLESQIPR